MTGCVSLAVTGRFSESSFVPAGTMNGPRDLPVTASRLGLLMLVGVPMNIGFGSFSFSSSVACLRRERREHEGQQDGQCDDRLVHLSPRSFSASGASAFSA